MKLTIDGIRFNLLFDDTGLGKGKIPLIFLHGFTGSADDWHFIFDKLPAYYLPIAVDLIGHGDSESPENTDFYSCGSIVGHLNSIIGQLGISELILSGYSMGGRAALSYIIKYPSKVKAAILESTSPGIEEICAKKQRVELDLLLADKILREGIESFTDFWFDTPLFSTIKKLPGFESEKKKRNRNNPVGLANILTGFSTGFMPSYWKRITSIKQPVLLISGAFDEKYTGINKKMNAIFPNSQHYTVADAGHNVHLEKPMVFTKLVVNFLTTIERQE